MRKIVLAFLLIIASFCFTFNANALNKLDKKIDTITNSFIKKIEKQNSKIDNRINALEKVVKKVDLVSEKIKNNNKYSKDLKNAIIRL
jgi:peptidoglycan hydrolase CwlO-like protein